MEGSREHMEANRYSTGRTDQVQTPPEERPLLGGAPAQERTRIGSEQLAAAVSPHRLAHRHWQAIYDEGFSLTEELTDKLGDVLQPPSQGMHSPRKARGAQRFGQVVHMVHHEQGSLMVGVEVHRRHYRHEQHFRVGDPCQRVALMPQFMHRIGNDAVSRYNLYVVHVALPPNGWFSDSIL